jgi:hypothetical protein
MAPPPGNSVPIPRNVLAALVAGVVVLLVAVAFLLGRESKPGTPAGSAAATLPPVTAPLPSGATGEEAPAVASTQSGDSSSESEAPPASNPIPGAPLGTEPGLAAAAPPGSASPPSTPQEDPSAAAVRKYFVEIEALQAQGKYWSDDAQSFGRTLIDQASRGDASGFDELIAANQRVRDSVAAMSVPSPCAEHHSRTLRLLDEGLSLLKDVKSRFVSEDMTGLETITTTAYGIQNRAKEVDALAAEIKKRYGIAQ